MKLKLDENMPASLVAILSPLGHDVDTVPIEGLRGCADSAVWEATQAADRLLITQDLDFSDLRHFPPGKHPGILLMRLRGPDRQALIDHVRSLFESEDVESWRGCLIISTEHKIRIRREQL